MSWNEIFGVDAPVQGLPSEFVSARDTFSDMEQRAQNVVDEFAVFNENGLSAGNLNGPPAEALAEAISQVDKGLQDLPRIAREASAIFESHRARLGELREAADEALGRAETLWSTYTSLEGQEDKEEEREDAERDLRAIYNGGLYGDSEYASLAGSERERNQQTIEDLDNIDRGELDDPGWLEKIVSAVGNFVGGILENIANLIEGLLTGDWAAVLWALNGLLDAALLILGTIALFTGVGAPLFFLTLGALAVKTTLAATQMPNPQTGQTMGWGEVALTAAGAVLSAGGAVRAFQAGGTRMQLFTGFRNSAGQLNGGLFSTARNVRNLSTYMRTAGQPGLANFNAMRTAADGLKMRTFLGIPAARTGPLANSFITANGRIPLYTTARVAWDVTGRVGTAQRWGDFSLGGPIDSITRAGSLDAVANTGTGGSTHRNVGTGWVGGDIPLFENGAGDTGTNGWGNDGSMLFGDTPVPTPAQITQISEQAAAGPDVCIVTT